MKKISLIICFSLISVFTFSQWVWQNPLPQGSSLNSVFFTNANTGYMVGDGGTILKTFNGGTTWSTLSSGTTANLRSTYFTDSNTGYAVGYEIGDWNGTILKTINGGTNWTVLLIDGPKEFFSVFFIDANTGYAVGYDRTLASGLILKNPPSKKVDLKSPYKGLKSKLCCSSNRSCFS